MQIYAKPIPALLAASRSENSLPKFLISVYGNGQARNRFQVTQLLSKQKMNITDLHTKAIPQKNRFLICHAHRKPSAHPVLQLKH